MDLLKFSANAALPISIAEKLSTTQLAQATLGAKKRRRAAYVRTRLRRGYRATALKY